MELNISERVQKALEFFDAGYNCAQSVLLAYAPDYGLKKEEATAMAASFGGGMGRLREVCGAASGMFMVLGLHHPYEVGDKQAKTANYQAVQRTAKAFKDEMGSYVCADLLHIRHQPDSPEPAERTSDYYASRPCRRCVATAARLVGEELAASAATSGGATATTPDFASATAAPVATTTSPSATAAPAPATTAPHTAPTLATTSPSATTPATTAPSAVIPLENPQPLHQITCLNCGTVHDDRYCPVCGQRNDTCRFNGHELVRSITRGFFNADRGFVYTLRTMCTRPGRVIREYLEGKRVRYFPPFSLLFVVAAFYAVIKKLVKLLTPATKDAVDITQDSVKDAMAETTKALGEEISLNADKIITLKDIPFIDSIVDTFTNNYALIVLLALPFFVLAMRACFRRSFRKRFNWAETFLIGAFLIAQYFLVMGVIGLTTALFPSFDGVGDLLSSAGLACLLAWNMFDLTTFKHKSTYFWRGIGMVFFFFFLVLGAIALVSLLFLVVVIKTQA